MNHSWPTAYARAPLLRRPKLEIPPFGPKAGAHEGKGFLLGWSISQGFASVYHCPGNSLKYPAGGALHWVDPMENAVVSHAKHRHRQTLPLRAAALQPVLGADRPVVSAHAICARATASLRGSASGRSACALRCRPDRACCWPPTTVAPAIRWFSDCSPARSAGRSMSWPVGICSCKAACSPSCCRASGDSAFTAKAWTANR